MTITEHGLFWALLFSTGCAPERLSIQAPPTGPAAINSDDIRRDAWKLRALDSTGRLNWLRRRGEQHGLEWNGECFSGPNSGLTLNISSELPPVEAAMALAVSRAVSDLRVCIAEETTLKCVEQAPWLSTEAGIEIGCGVDGLSNVDSLTQALREWVKKR